MAQTELRALAAPGIPHLAAEACSLLGGSSYSSEQVQRVERPVVPEQVSESPRSHDFP